MIKKILLDLDDVLVDCTSACMRYMGLFDYDVSRDYPSEVGRDIYKAYEHATGVLFTPELFWRHFDQEFWANLPLTPWCHDLVQLANEMVGHENVFICTATTANGACQAGKLQWIDRNLGYSFVQRSILTASKFACASPDTMLIDDCVDNNQKFRWEGGMAVDFPAPWNENRTHLHRAFEYTKRSLELHQVSV